MTASAVASCSAAEAWASKSAASSASSADIEGTGVVVGEPRRPSPPRRSGRPHRRGRRPRRPRRLRPRPWIDGVGREPTSGSGAGRRTSRASLASASAAAAAIQASSTVMPSVDSSLRRCRTRPRRHRPRAASGPRPRSRRRRGRLGAERAREAILRQVGLRPQVRLRSSSAWTSCPLVAASPGAIAVWACVAGASRPSIGAHVRHRPSVTFQHSPHVYWRHVRQKLKVLWNASSWCAVAASSSSPRASAIASEKDASSDMTKFFMPSRASGHGRPAIAAVRSIRRCSGCRTVRRTTR